MSGHLAWTEGDGVADCGAEAVVTADDGALRPAHLVAVDDMTSFAVALELSYHDGDGGLEWTSHYGEGEPEWG